MGAGRHTQTVLVDSSGSGQQGNFAHRGLDPRDLGAVIFVCNGETMQECIDKQLFGLPRPHIAYVQHIVPGMPLFLFNYDDRALHGVFAAAGNGCLLIEPHAWSPNGKAPTRFPAQVRVRLEFKAAPLPEKVFSRVIKENYVAAGRFMFELTKKQMHEIVSLFSKGKVAAAPPVPLAAPPAPALPAPPPPPPSQPAKVATTTAPAATVTAWKKVVKDPPPRKDSFPPPPPPPPPAAVEPKVESLALLPPSPPSDVERIVLGDPAAQLILRQEAGILEGILEKLQVTDPSRSSKTSFSASAAPEKCGLVADMAAEREKLTLVSSGGLLDQSVANAVDRGLGMCMDAVAEMRETELLLDKTMEELRAKGECLNKLDVVRAKNLELAAATVALKGEVEELTEEVATLRRLITPQALYLIGGARGEERDRSVDKFVLRSGELSQTSPLLAPRSCSAAAVLDSRIYVFGGTIHDRSVTSTEMYDMGRNVWKLREPMSIARAYQGGVVAGGKIFALGGRDSSDFFSDTEVLDLELGWLPAVPMLDKRAAFASVVVDGAIYAFGGTDGRLYLETAERYDPRDSAWRRLPSMGSSRLWFQSVAFGDKVYAFGGHNGVDYLASVERFDPRAGKWETIKPLACPRAHGAAAVVDGTICIVAGLNKKLSFTNTIECYREDSSSRLVEVCDLRDRSLFSLGVV